MLLYNEKAEFCHLLKKRMEIYPDAMYIKRIANIIGCSDSTLRKHVQKGHLFAILQDRKYLVSKYSLIIKRCEAASSLVSE